MDREEFGKEFVLNQPYDYEECGIGYAKDGIRRNVIYYKPKDKFGYIVKQADRNDESYFAPRILYKAGQKVGVNLPEIELGLFHVLDDWDESFSQAFFSGSCIFYTDSSKYERYSGFQRLSQKQILEMYKKHVNSDEDLRMWRKPTFDDYVNANMYFLTTRASKPVSHFSKGEITAIRQELIDRAMFGLRFGTEGENEVLVYNGSNATLSSYYPTVSRTLGLNFGGDRLDDGLVNQSDEEFGAVREWEAPAQYDIAYGQEKSTTPSELLKYMFDKYPDETEKAYKKMQGYTTQDLQDELNSYTTMSGLHKKFAIRDFECRGKVLDEVYQEYLKTKTLETR